MSWTHPICEECADDVMPANRPRFRLKLAEEEKCGWCGKITHSGLYYRANPNAIPYPSTD